MKTLAGSTSPSLIIPCVSGVTPFDVIPELVDALDGAGWLGDRATFLNAVMAREQLSPTCFTGGLALPHARLPDLPRLAFALGRSSRPFNWNGGDGCRVQMVLLFAVPELETKAYLNLIASVARLSQNGTLWQQLLLAPDAGSIYSVLEQVSVREVRPPSLAAAAS